MRLGLTMSDLGAILSGNYEMGEGQVTSLILLFQVLEALPSEAPDGSVDEELLELLGADDPELDYDWDFDAEGMPTTDAGMARLERELGLGGPREADTVPGPVVR